MNEPRGEIEDLVARVVEEMSNRKRFSFREVTGRAPGIDQDNIFAILKEMEKFGAVKPKTPFWGVSRGKDPGPFYRADAQKVALFRENYAAPPPYNAKYKPLPPIPTQKPLPAQPRIATEKSVENIVLRDAEQILKYQANQLAKSLDWPIRKYLSSSEGVGESIATAASHRASETKHAENPQHNPDKVISGHSVTHNTKLTSGRTR